MRLTFGGLVAAALVVLAGCAQETGREAPIPPHRDIVETVAAAAEFTTLATALERAGLTDTLQGPGPFTVFAPNNDAFAALPPGQLAQLLQPMNRDRLRAVLLHHVVSGRIVSGDLVGRQETATTLGGDAVLIDGSGIGLTVAEAAVIAPDQLATNGVIHVVDTVLLPE